MDRDTEFTAEFRQIIEAEGTKCVLLPPKSPNCNAFIERFMLSLKSECLDRMIFFGEKSLRNATVQFVEHYHTERNHQSLDNKLILPGPKVGRATGEIECRERPGGLLNYYHRRARAATFAPAIFSRPDDLDARVFPTFRPRFNSLTRRGC